jgi:pyruvate kinase
LTTVRAYFLDNKLVKKGEKVVITTGTPFGKVSHLTETNLILVEQI